MPHAVSFLSLSLSYQIARVLSRSQAREGHGLRFDELQDRVLPNLELPPNALRQRLKQVAIYDKNTSIWTTKQIGYEDYPGVDALGKSISCEGVVAFETASASSRRLTDLGVHTLFAGSHTVISVGVTMVYLAGQLNATRELARKMKKLFELSRANRSIQPTQISFYEKAAEELEAVAKRIRMKHEVRQAAAWECYGSADSLFVSNTLTLIIGSNVHIRRTAAHTMAPYWRVC
jgi:hypothetical protein